MMRRTSSASLRQLFEGVDDDDEEADVDVDVSLLPTSRQQHQHQQHQQHPTLLLNGAAPTQPPNATLARLTAQRDSLKAAVAQLHEAPTSRVALVPLP